MARISRDIKYLNRDFSSIRQSLLDYSKTYFPSTFNDFTPTSTGVLFIEMAAYVGDVLSFYLDNQIQETFLTNARQTDNIFNMAYTLGYRPRVTQASTVDIDVFQQIPSKVVGGNFAPDFDFALKIPENTGLTTTNGVNFLMQDSIDFTVSSSLDPTEITLYKLTGNSPDFYLLKKTRKAISATISTIDFTFGSPIKFSTRTITANNIIGILDVFDSDGNQYYEVDNLSQDLIFNPIKNTNPNNPYFNVSDLDAPFLLKTKQVQRRFVSRFINPNNLELQFGAGTTNDNSEEITPNPNNVGLGLPFKQNKLTTAFSPLNYTLTNTYGIAPSNTRLTIRYLTGGGIKSNVDAGTINRISSTSGIRFVNSSISNNSLANTIFSSIAVTNPIGADGGGNGDTIDEIKINTLGQFPTQLRNVTSDDYLVRALSMPSDFGTISKAYAIPTLIGETNPGEIPAILDLYILTFDVNGKLKTSSNTLKQNLRTYLSEHRMINDSVNIKDAFIINIGVDFEIIVRPGFNNNDVLTNCVNQLQLYFRTDTIQINEPIILSDLFPILDGVDGVQTVKDIKVLNKTGGNYSEFAYDIDGATINRVIYPSIDPMIFEVKFPNDDIRGRVVPL
tara:strand:- start:1124 stop:2980 length:1857 start_codon:yes stop_codon:yes gene_type:complete